MKKIINVITLALAMNFLLVVGAGGWLYSSGHLDKAKFVEVKKILFPPVVPVVAATQPAPTTGPSSRLDELLAKASGRTVNDQVNSIRQAFAAEQAELDRRARVLDDLQQQIDLAKDQAGLDRVKIETEQKAVDARQVEQNRLASDQGFQDSLAVYNAMKPKQVKTIFMTLSDDTVVEYIRAMEPRTATKIINEFKLPEEIARIQKILEKIRLSQPASPPAAGPQAALPPQ
jgi:flagellar motility protein MotE (MotC chaperone)